MKKSTALFVFLSLCAVSAWSLAGDGQGKGVNMISGPVIEKSIASLVSKHGSAAAPRIEKGVRQVARLWQESDGSEGDFESFCTKSFIGSDEEKEIVFQKLSRNFEILWGHFNKITLDLQAPLQLDLGPIHTVDQIFGGYSAGAHLDEDFYQNKIAFITALNFPYYSLAEKNRLGTDWSRKEWAYARMGDVFAVRIPPRLVQHYSRISSDTDLYIAEYNIFMGKVRGPKGEKLFPEGLKLLTHWNLRDELKSNYGSKRGLEKQKIIYKIMEKIISQEIPREVINRDNLEWDPFKGKVYRDGRQVEWNREPDERYRQLLNNFKALSAFDAYCPPGMDTYIKRKFDGEMEISQPEVEALFTKFVSSPQVKKVARLIRKRLGRKLQPFDIWYDGFKARSGIPEEKLDQITAKKYPTPKAMEKDLPAILVKLGFTEAKAQKIASKIAVDPARGSGHAWGAEMKAEKARLRTRVPATGMNYKGYNIAIHEFGHNVEQTVSLHDVDYYMMQGVPNTAFTEALAFIFQGKDLELLGLEESNPNKKYLETLDTFWSAYESMGVSLVDMKVWKWMYANPDADVTQLKQAVIEIAKDTWNKYYAEVLGGKDQPLLAIYSHMIAYPLYLSAYSYGDLIDFQIEQYLEGKEFAPEILRMFSAGRLTPRMWMKNAVGKEISIEPVLTATDLALKHITK